MMVKSLQATLTKATSLQITPHIASVTINSVVMAPLLFKLILHLATIFSKATSKVLCNNLQTLDSYMTTCGSDINMFHLYFYTNYNQLVGRGEHIDDPLSLLWDGYKVCPDSAFRKYMEAKEEDVLEERDYIKDVNYKGLIMMATNKYNILKKSGKWEVKSSEEEKIMALLAELNNPKGKLKLSKN